MVYDPGLLAFGERAGETDWGLREDLAVIGRVILAFFLRDVRRAVSYRFTWVIELALLTVTVAIFYFLAQLIDASATPALAATGGDYFSFVLIGIAFAACQKTGLTAFAHNLRQDQYIGTLEPVLAAPVRIPAFLAGSTLWGCLTATAKVAFTFVLALAVFGVVFPSTALLPAVIAALLALTAFMGIGVLMAAFVLRFKRGTPVALLIATGSELLGGVYFPTALLPEWLRHVSDWIPMTHALNALRASLLNGAGFPDIATSLTFLAVFSVVIWGVGIFGFKLALAESKADGTLGHY